MTTKFIFSHGSSAIVLRKLLGRIAERCVSIPIEENAALIENLASILWYHVNVRIKSPGKFQDEKNQNDLEFEEPQKVADAMAVGEAEDCR